MGGLPGEAGSLREMVVVRVWHPCVPAQSRGGADLPMFARRSRNIRGRPRPLPSGLCESVLTTHRPSQGARAPPASALGFGELAGQRPATGPACVRVCASKSSAASRVPPVRVGSRALHGPAGIAGSASEPGHPLHTQDGPEEASSHTDTLGSSACLTGSKPHHQPLTPPQPRSTGLYKWERNTRADLGGYCGKQTRQCRAERELRVNCSSAPTPCAARGLPGTRVGGRGPSSPTARDATQGVGHPGPQTARPACPDRTHPPKPRSRLLSTSRSHQGPKGMVS